MIFERMAGINVLRKMRQLETISRPILFGSACKVPQFARTSTNLAGINRCLNSTLEKNTNCRLLNKFPIASTPKVQQTRGAATQGDHVRLWVFERILSVALPVLLPIALIAENPILDCAVATAIVMHSHWGLEAVIVDYARPIVVGPIVPKIAHLSLNILSALTLAGLLVLIYNGPGISKSIKDFWAIGKKQEKV